MTIGSSLIVVGLRGDVSNAGAPSTSGVLVAGDPAVVPPEQRPMAASDSVVDSRRAPVSIDVPEIDVAAGVASLGLNEDQTVEVPEDPDDAGWYSKGTTPGDNGSAVILGHVDSKTGPAVFYRLHELDPGDQVALRLSDGTIQHFEVDRVRRYPNEEFPASRIYSGSPTRPALNIVTCGGEYDRANGGYQSNVVVYTTYLWSTDAEESGERSTTSAP